MENKINFQDSDKEKLLREQAYLELQALDKIIESGEVHPTEDQYKRAQFLRNFLFPINDGDIKNQ